MYLEPAVCQALCCVWKTLLPLAFLPPLHGRCFVAILETGKQVVGKSQTMASAQEL
jgi:hypothetical protein